MSQNPMFTFPAPSFDPSQLYPNDMSLQFASSVPRPQYAYAGYPNDPALLSHQAPFESNPDLPKHQSKAERRAEHNATERARRENLNAKFQQLAHTLPNLQNDSRNSKSAIIDRTLDYIHHSVMKEEYMQTRIKELEKINHLLLSQLDERCTTTKRTQEILVPSAYYTDHLDLKKLDEQQPSTTFIYTDQRQFN
ncbi:hypothetical protein BY458DRAFT_558786 [Sporodiniella umbellata]|nr:hypothetical protein BY458DRAFT_558786 [Sporodiniella umbellata]